MEDCQGEFVPHEKPLIFAIFSFYPIFCLTIVPQFKIAPVTNQLKTLLFGNRDSIVTISTTIRLIVYWIIFQFDLSRLPPIHLYSPRLIYDRNRLILHLPGLPNLLQL